MAFDLVTGTGGPMRQPLALSGAFGAPNFFQTSQMGDLSALLPPGYAAAAASGAFGRSLSDQAVAASRQVTQSMPVIPPMPTVPSLPTIQPPSMPMPTMPTLQPVARMPSMSDAEIQAARDKAKKTIAERAGRTSTFLTTTTRAASLTPTIAQSTSRFARRTYG